MGFFGKALEIGEKFVERAEKQYDRQLDSTYREIIKRERTATSKEELEKINTAKLNIERQRSMNGKLSSRINAVGNFIQSNSNSGAYENVRSLSNTYGGKTIEEWNHEWECIGPLKSCNLTPYNRCVGLYRMVIGGETKYVGRAIELNNGGFRKRLSDYRRESDSARKHNSGSTIHQHIDEIQVYLLIVGNDQEAVNVTRKLEGLFIALYKPEWNRQINI